ncbi:hypothetical protein SCHPADRAFT_1000671 [Schizopora paradoxa]|uniref:Uncharacterized protein n=1 Tax=Schizopora paradoxa TaxID=27342 RepID=A0A0H2RVJ8_9AGAM|nr:hypothetical protein SCHPADRAFT_1000671 [Schizopora paradoxa]
MFDTYTAHNWRNLLLALAILARCLDDFSAISTYRLSLARFLASELSFFNRYYKLLALNYEILEFKPFLFSSDFAGEERKAHLWKTREPFRSGTHRLFLRLVLNGSCQVVDEEKIVPDSISLESSFGHLIKELLHKHSNQNISVDILIYGPEEVLELEVGEDDSFDATGHFPILLGYDESGRALYCARDKFSGDRNVFFRGIVGVADGSSSGIFMKYPRKKRNSKKFGVLVLRFDPSDVVAHNANNVEGALDPTGPLHWRRLWPLEDPSLQSLTTGDQYNRIKSIHLSVDECMRKASRQPNSLNKHEDVTFNKDKPGASETGYDTSRELEITNPLQDANNETRGEALRKTEESQGYSNAEELNGCIRGEMHDVQLDGEGMSCIQSETITVMTEPKEGMVDEKIKSLEAKIHRLEEELTASRAELEEIRR